MRAKLARAEVLAAAVVSVGWAQTGDSLVPHLTYPRQIPSRGVVFKCLTSATFP
jgi:hypothetical protein